MLKRKILIFLIILITSLTFIFLYSKRRVILRDYFDNKMVLITSPLLETMFGGEVSEEDKKFIEEIGRKKLQVFISKPQFFRSLEVVEKWEETILRQAQDKSLPGEITLGMALLENGGAEDAISYAGAAGVFQITENTAQILGLDTEENPPAGGDERLEPKKNIEAGLRYLSNNLKLFPDIGVAVWSYHAGEQNISNAIKVYLQDLGEEDAYSLLEAVDIGKLDRAKEVWRAYLTKDNLNIHKLLQNQKVKDEIIENLGDETELYPYKVFALSVLYDVYKSYENRNEFVNRIELYRQGRIVLSDLLIPSID